MEKDKEKKKIDKFLSLDYKRFKKKNKDLSKKEIKIAWSDEVTDMLLDVIELVSKRSKDDDDVKKKKQSIFKKIIEFNMFELVLDKIDDIDKAMKLILPMFVFDFKLFIANAVNGDKEINSELTELFNMNIKYSQKLLSKFLKKRIKSLVNEGIGEDVAIDIATCVPNNASLEPRNNAFYTTAQLFNVLYNHSIETSDGVDIPKIFDIVGDKHKDILCLYALSERQSKTVKFTDSQLDTWANITKTVFDIMEKELSADEVETVLSKFASRRDADRRKGRDGIRRFAISELSDTEYPKIKKCLKRVIDENASIADMFNK